MASNLRILPEDRSAPLDHRWRMCVGQGRAGELLREDVIEQLGRARAEIGFSYLRFHGLFHDEMAVVTRRGDGSLCFQWRMIDRIFDAMLRAGLRPFVELNPMPLALASGTQTIFHWKMNVTPPRDLAEWGELLGAFARHCVQRYGADEVRTWYFEVWNEPNLPGFWSGSRDEYWELYRQSAAALKSVDAGLRIGGPATAQGRWIPELIAWCEENAVPLDFVTTHSYLQDEQTFYPCRDGSPHAPSDYLLDQFRRVHGEVAASARPDLEIHWTEWNTLAASAEGKVSWTDNPSVDALYAGSAALHHAVRADALCASMSWWVVSDLFGEGGVSPLPFSHTYGLLTAHGIPKPAFHAFRWLARMTGERLGVDPLPSNPAQCIVATREASTVRALAWYHPPVEDAAGEWSGALTLDLDRDTLRTTAQLGAGSGSAYEIWCAWGSPPNLTPSQEDALRGAATPAFRAERVSGGSDTIPFRLRPYEVLFVEWAPAEAPAENRGILREAAPQKLETDLAAASS